MGIGERLAHQHTVVAFFNLLDGPGIVVAVEKRYLSVLVSSHIVRLGYIRGNRDITAVQDLQVANERVRLKWYVIASAVPQWLNFQTDDESAAQEMETY